MAERTFFEEMKSYVGFDDGDAAKLRSLAAVAAPLFPGVVERFYEVLFQHPSAKEVFVGGENQIQRQKQVLGKWLSELFQGNPADEYFSSRARIGSTHVRIGLPQRYMPLAMEVIWSHLSEGLRRLQIEGIESKLLSLHKLMTLDLTIMLESYQASHLEKMREFERRAVEGQLMRSRHLAEIGQLAASLAHEVKNPLAGISGAIQVIGGSLPEDSPYKSIIQAILGQISRLDDTVKDLLLYARPAPPRRTPLKLGELMSRITSVLREEPAMRTLDIRLRGADQTIHADERQLEQLLMNLILNAAQASGESSYVEVEISEKDEGKRLALSIRDIGIGMSRAVRERAMEPFFTTKARGTGLGLAICRKIAESHGGSLGIESEPGRGTTVTVDLPNEPDASVTEIQ